MASAVLLKHSSRTSPPIPKHSIFHNKTSTKVGPWLLPTHDAVLTADLWLNNSFQNWKKTSCVCRTLCKDDWEQTCALCNVSVLLFTVTHVWLTVTEMWEWKWGWRDFDTREPWWAHPNMQYMQNASNLWPVLNGLYRYFKNKYSPYQRSNTLSLHRDKLSHLFEAEPIKRTFVVNTFCVGWLYFKHKLGKIDEIELIKCCLFPWIYFINQVKQTDARFI